MSRLRAQKLPDARHEVLAAGWVVPEPLRCVQCGICSFNCPIDIDVRRHAWLDEPIRDSHCLTRLLLATSSHAIKLRLPGVEIHYHPELAEILAGVAV